MNLTAVCISRNDEAFDMEIPYHNEVSEEDAGPKATVERVKFISELRNQAMEKTLGKYPETSHVLMIDSYYLTQTDAVQKLVDDYELAIDRWNGYYDEKMLILGGAIWTRHRTRLSHPWVHTSYYDWGSTPEAKGYSPKWKEWRRVRAVGGCYIFPVEIWKSKRYRANPDHFETEHVGICRGQEVFLDLNARFWRRLVYPYRKMVRIAAGDILRRIRNV